MGGVVDPYPAEAGRSSVAFDIAQQPRLTDAGFASDYHRTASAGRGSALQHVHETRPLGVAAYERSCARGGVADHAAYRAQLVDPHGATLAPQQALTHPLDAGARCDGRCRGLVEEHFPGFRELLESCRGRHRFAREGHRARARHLPYTRDHFSGSDSDSKLERTRVADDDAPKRLLHLDGAQARSQRIVVVRDRHAKDGQNGVPDELLERPAEVDDGFSQRLESAIDSGANLLRVELVHQLRVPDEVREECRDDPAVALFQIVHGAVEATAAEMAKARSRVRRRGAIWAGHYVSLGIVDIDGTPYDRPVARVPAEPGVRAIATSGNGQDRLLSGGLNADLPGNRPGDMLQCLGCRTWLALRHCRHPN